MNWDLLNENLNILISVNALTLLCFAVMCFSFAFDKIDELIKKKKKK